MHISSGEKKVKGGSRMASFVRKTRASEKQSSLPKMQDVHTWIRCNNQGIESSECAFVLISCLGQQLARCSDTTSGVTTTERTLSPSSLDHSFGFYLPSISGQLTRSLISAEIKGVYIIPTRQSSQLYMRLRLMLCGRAWLETK